MVLGIAQPTDVNDLFNHWSKGGNQSQSELIDCSRRIMLVIVDIKK
jgi:hypothetical protein